MEFGLTEIVRVGNFTGFFFIISFAERLRNRLRKTKN